MIKPRIFITHRHRYNAHYWNLEQKLRTKFAFDNLSVHNHKFEDDDLPIDFLLSTISNRIKQCNVFIVVGRRYVGRAEWCKWEIDTAMALGKLIATWSPHGKSPAEAPARLKKYSGHIGSFSQARALATRLRNLSFMV